MDFFRYGLVPLPDQVEKVEKTVAATQVNTWTFRIDGWPALDVVQSRHRNEVLYYCIALLTCLFQPKISFRKRKNQSLRERDDDDWESEDISLDKYNKNINNSFPILNMISLPVMEGGSMTVDSRK